MSRFYRKGIAFALTLSMSASMLAGCGGKNNLGGNSLGLDVERAYP